jgi:hypothetical protein
VQEREGCGCVCEVGGACVYRRGVMSQSEQPRVDLNQVISLDPTPLHHRPQRTLSTRVHSLTHHSLCLVLTDILIKHTHSPLPLLLPCAMPRRATPSGCAFGRSTASSTRTLRQRPCPSPSIWTWCVCACSCAHLATLTQTPHVSYPTTHARRVSLPPLVFTPRTPS